MNAPLQPASNMKCSSSLVILFVLHCCTSLSLRIGTRSSKLAQTQARQFQEIIERRHKGIKATIIPIDASGDKTGAAAKTSTQQLPLAIQGVDFTGALDEALADGIVDVVVHSLKDIPPANRWRINADEPRIKIGAYLGPRENPLDVLLSREYKSIESLPVGGKVGSASLRRQAQLLACRPDLEIINIRGNVDARLAALDRGELDGLILACAGLKRLGILSDDNTSYKCNPIQADVLLPCAGQGIIAVTCRENDARTISLLREVDHHDNRIAATTERSFLDSVDHLSPWSGRPPVAGLMTPPASGEELWHFRGLLATPDGTEVLTVKKSLNNNNCNETAALNLGRNAAADLLTQACGDFLDGYYKL
ncbi:porphobilinogen deaminase [Skeletonema marinoi]|uniref:hydroxymethylbilane synthase n=1 Tax=Skeletonema marinoi TaxID=267567 RepID=A0AAD8YAL5_9STRA|nr:porphobilinogen deaminase [Skeletonema marinoi]